MTQSAWDILGVQDSADSRTIRRAYAARLKTSRPEDDAAAFQVLTDAYEWAMGDARRRALEPPGEPQAPSTPPPPVPLAGQTEVAKDMALPELGRALESSEPVPSSDPALPPSDDDGFAFGPFFSALADRIRERDPEHLRRWLDEHPDLYSIELKWALMPHIFDTLAHNASMLDPHRGHLEALTGFFGVDARLRRHPALAPALDFLERAQWRQEVAAPSTSSMPRGWENLANVLDDSRQGPPRPRKPIQTTWAEKIADYWWVVFLILLTAQIGRFFSQ
nr:J domain-containing protein [uncultured Pseudoxanthomonas sp.]